MKSSATPATDPVAPRSTRGPSRTLLAVVLMAAPAVALMALLLVRQAAQGADVSTAPRTPSNRSRSTSLPSPPKKGVAAASHSVDDRRNTLERPRLLVVLIGGMDSDPSPEQIAGTARRHEGNSGLFQLAHDLADPRIRTEYFNWNGSRAGDLKPNQPEQLDSITTLIRQHVQEHMSDRLAIVGNSWGGHTAWDVARKLVQHEQPLAIHLAIFLDASSTGRGPRRPPELPININRAAHYFTRNVFVWGAWPVGDRLVNIDLGNPASGFRIAGGPAYDSPFNFPAHVAAEWDERIHADIKQRLLRLLDE